MRRYRGLEVYDILRLKQMATKEIMAVRIKPKASSGVKSLDHRPSVKEALRRSGIATIIPIERLLPVVRDNNNAIVDFAYPYHLAFTPFGIRYCASYRSSARPEIPIVYVNGESGKVVRVLKHHRDFPQIDISADGRKAVTCSRHEESGDLVLWDLTKGERIATQRPIAYWEYPSFSQDGRYVIACDHDSKTADVVVFDGVTLAPVWRLRYDTIMKNEVYPGFWKARFLKSPDIFVAICSRQVMVVDGRKQYEIHRVRDKSHNDPNPRDLWISEDGSRFLCPNVELGLDEYAFEHGNVRRLRAIQFAAWESPRSPIIGMSKDMVSQNGATLVCVDSNGGRNIIGVFSVNTGEHLRTIDCGQDGLNLAAVSPDGMNVAIVKNLWDKRIRGVPEYTNQVIQVVDLVP